MKHKKIVRRTVYHILVCLGAFVMVYPLLWMLMSSFKETNTIFTTASELIPRKFTLANYATGWKGFGKPYWPLPGPCCPRHLSPTALPDAISGARRSCSQPCWFP